MKSFLELQQAINGETTPESFYKMIKLCMQNKEFDINQLSEEGFGLLHYTVVHKRADLAKVLLVNGANILIESKPLRHTVLDLTIREGILYYTDAALAKFFIEEISKLKKEKQIDSKVLDECLAKGRGRGYLLINWALRCANYDVASLLTSIGSPIPPAVFPEVLHRWLKNIVLKGDREVLQRISSSLYPGDIKLIIDRLDEEGRTLLSHAIKLRNPGLCAQLISLGANVNIASDGLSPANQASCQLYLEDNGRNAASFSAVGPSNQILAMLINNGANLKEILENNISLLCDCVISYRRSDFSTLTNPQIRELWILMHQIILNANRYDIPNLYEDEKTKKDFLSLFGYAVRLEGLDAGIAGEEIINSYLYFSGVPAVQTALNAMLNEIYGTQHKNFLDEESLSKEGKNINMLISIALSNLGQIPTIKEMTEAIHTGQLAIVPILTAVRTPDTPDHTMTYLFYDHLCARVNCGGTSRPPEGTGGVVISRVGNLPELIKALPYFANSQRKCINDSYLMGDFRKTCGLMDVFKITLDRQTVGNCSWRSSEALVRAIIFMYIYKAVFENTRDVDISLNRAEQYSALWFRLFLIQDREYAFHQLATISLPHLASIGKSASTRAIDLIPHRIRQLIMEGREKENKAFEAEVIRFTKEKEKKEAVNAFEVSAKDLQEYISLHLHDPNYINAILILSFGLEDDLSVEARHKQAMEHLSSLAKKVGADSVEVTKEHLYRFEFQDVKNRKSFSDEITRIKGSPRARP